MSDYVCGHCLVAMQEAEVAPVITEYWEKAEFPRKLLPALAKLNLSGGNIEGYGCAVSNLRPVGS